MRPSASLSLPLAHRLLAALETPEERGHRSQTMPILAEFSVEQQIYRSLVDAASTPLGGIYQKDMRIRGFSQKRIRKLLAHLAQERGVIAVPTSIGKSQTFLMKVSLSEEEKANVLKARQLTAQTTAESQRRAGAGAAAAPATQDDDLGVEETEGEIRPIKKGAHMRFTTVQNLARRDFCYEVVKNERIVLQLRIRKLLEEKTGVALAAKQVKGYLSTLIEEKKIDYVDLNLPLLSGPKTLGVAKLPEISLDSEEFEAFKLNAQQSEYVKRVPAPHVRKEAEVLLDMPPHPRPSVTTGGFGVAFSYGFIRNLMVRVRLFHRMLWTLAVSTGALAEAPTPAAATVILGLNVGAVGKPTELRAAASDLINEEVIRRRPFAVAGVEVELSRAIASSVSPYCSSFAHVGLCRMSVEFYLQVIGSTWVVEGLDQYRTTPTLVSSLPPSVRKALFQRRNYLRRTLHLVGIMQDLSLLRPGTSRVQDPSFPTKTIGSSVQMCSFGQLLDRDERCVYSYDFEISAQQDEYWRDLETFSSREMFASALEEDKPHPAAFPETAEEFKLPTAAVRSYSWRGRMRMTKFQSLVLSDRLDAVLAETPDLSVITPEVARVATAIQVTPAQALLMYRDFVHLQKARAVRAARRVEGADDDEEPEESSDEGKGERKRKRPAEPEDSQGDELLKSPSPQRRRHRAEEASAPATIEENPSQLAPLVKQIQRAKGRLAPLSTNGVRRGRPPRPTASLTTKPSLRPAETTTDQNEAQILIIPDGDDEKPRRIQVRWKPSEDLQLLRIVANEHVVQATVNASHARVDVLTSPAVELNVFFEGIDFQKISDELAVPAKASLVCRKRLRLLVKKPNNLRILQAAIAQCSRRRQDQLGDTPPVLLRPLAATLDKLLEKFTIQRVQALVWQADSDAYSHAAETIKSIMMLPEENYVLEAAKRVLCKFTEADVERAFAELKEHRFLSKWKAAQGRALRGYRVHQRFEAATRSPFPPFFLNEVHAGQRQLLKPNEREADAMEVDLTAADVLEADARASRIDLSILPQPGFVAAALSAACQDAVVLLPTMPISLKRAAGLRQKGRYVARHYRRPFGEKSEAVVVKEEESAAEHTLRRAAGPEESPVTFSETDLPLVSVSVWNAMHRTDCRPSEELLEVPPSDNSPPPATWAEFTDLRARLPLFDDFGEQIVQHAADDPHALEAHLALCDAVMNSMSPDGKPVSMSHLQQVLSRVSAPIGIVHVVDELVSFGLLVEAMEFDGPAFVLASHPSSNLRKVFKFKVPPLNEEVPDDVLPKIEYDISSSRTLHTPWQALDGEEDRSTFLSQFLIPVATYILQNPGVYESSLVEHFSLFRPAITFRVVDTLLALRLVRAEHTVVRPLESFAAVFASSGPTTLDPCAEEEFLLNRCNRNSPHKYERSVFPSVDILDGLADAVRRASALNASPNPE